MIQFKGIRDFDWTMFFVIMVICGLGVLQIFSATHDTIWQGSWWKQIIYIAAGVLLMWIATSIDYHALMGQIYPLYIASIVLLVAGARDRKAGIRFHPLDRAPCRYSPAGIRIRQDSDGRSAWRASLPN